LLFDPSAVIEAINSAELSGQITPTVLYSVSEQLVAAEQRASEA
jgi:hypothetical protein